MRALFGSSGFATAFAVAAAVAVALLFVGRRVPALLIAGIPVVVGSVAGFYAEDRGSATVVVGLALLAVSGFVTNGRNVALRSLALVPGAIVLALEVPDRAPDWAGPAVVAITMLTAVPIARFDLAAPRLLTPLLALTALGVYGAVPDTEYARAFVGALLAASLLSLAKQVRPFEAGTATTAGLLALVSVAGGYPRPASVVGAIGCLGLLALVPLVVRSIDFLRVATLSFVMGLFAAQLLIVVICSRGAGLRASTVVSAIVVAGTWAVAAAALVFVPALMPPTEPASGTDR